MDLLTAIDWKNAVAGALVGASPTLIGLAYRYYSLATRRQWRKYVGEFWLYHPSGTVPGEIREKNIRFRRSLSGRIKATIDQPPPVGLLFEGFLSLSRGRIVYVNLEESTQKERIQIILIDQLNPQFDITTGVLSGLNLNNRPLAVKIVLSRTRIRAKRARSLLTAPDRILSDDQVFPSRA